MDFTSGNMDVPNPFIYYQSLFLTSWWSWKLNTILMYMGLDYYDVENKIIMAYYAY